MKRTMLAILLAALTAIGFITFSTGNAGSWGCGPGVKCPTTTVPVTVNTTIVQSTTVPTTVPDTSVPTTVPDVTTTTTTTTTTAPPPEVSENPPSIERPPTDIKLAG